MKKVKYNTDDRGTLFDFELEFLIERYTGKQLYTEEAIDEAVSHYEKLAFLKGVAYTFLIALLAKILLAMLACF